MPSQPRQLARQVGGSHRSPGSKKKAYVGTSDKGFYDDFGAKKTTSKARSSSRRRRSTRAEEGFPGRFTTHGRRPYGTVGPHASGRCPIRKCRPGGPCNTVAPQTCPIHKQGPAFASERTVRVELPSAPPGGMTSLEAELCHHDPTDGPPIDLAVVHNPDVPRPYSAITIGSLKFEWTPEKTWIPLGTVQPCPPGSNAPPSVFIGVTMYDTELGVYYDDKEKDGDHSFSFPEDAVDLDLSTSPGDGTHPGKLDCNSFTATWADR